MDHRGAYRKAFKVRAAKERSQAIIEHRLTWRMWHPVFEFAASREQAIAQAIAHTPPHIPAGTELYYGMVGGQPVHVAI